VVIGYLDIHASLIYVLTTTSVSRSNVLNHSAISMLNRDASHRTIRFLIVGVGNNLSSGDEMCLRYDNDGAEFRPATHGFDPFFYSFLLGLWARLVADTGRSSDELQVRWTLPEYQQQGIPVKDCGLSAVAETIPVYRISYMQLATWMSPEETLPKHCRELYGHGAIEGSAKGGVLSIPNK
jgi:hypothetical protein